jgi:hypothetical protein
VAYTCNPSTQRQKDCEFEANLSYVASSSPGFFLKKQTKKQDTTTCLLKWPQSKHCEYQCWWESGAVGSFIYCWWECRMVQPLWKIAWQFLSTCLPYKIIILVLGTYPNELKTYVLTKICTHMFIYNCPNLDIARCPSIGEWVSYGTLRKWNIIQW